MTTSDYALPEKFVDDMAEYGYTVEACPGNTADAITIAISRGPLGCMREIKKDKLMSESDLMDALKAAILVNANEYFKLNNVREVTRDGFLEWLITLLNDLHFISDDALVHVLSGVTEITGKLDHDKLADSHTPDWMAGWLNDPES